MYINAVSNIIIKKKHILNINFINIIYLIFLLDNKKNQRFFRTKKRKNTSK